MKLNLTATGKSQEIILAYLQQNASDVLAKKINNGVSVMKDGKRLISKKDLNGFMAYASSEARKLAEKNAKSACVEDSIVYGWAIHYFEEDSIEGKLYNEDGTEYQPPKPVKPAVPSMPVKKVEPPKPKQQQGSLFDMLSSPTKDEITDQADDHEFVDEAENEGDEKPTEEEIAEVVKQEQRPVQANDHEQVEEVNREINPIYQSYLDIQRNYPDSIVFYRLGDFYEVFGQNAVQCAEALDLTLTSRDFGMKERVPMCGVPHHAFEPYLTKLIKKGFKAAVAESKKDIQTYPSFEQTVDPETGELLDDDPLDEEHLRTSFDKETMLYLYDLLDGKMDIV